MAERVVLVVHKRPVEVRPTTRPLEVRVSPQVAQVQPAEKNITIIEPEKRVTDLVVSVDQGPPGPPGPSGPPGPPGPEGLTWRGPWDANTDYVEDDVVEYQGSSYVAVAPSRGVPPPSDSSKWHILAAGGSVDGGEW